MKTLTKTTLGCAIVGAALSAAAVDLTLDGTGIVYNDITGLSVDSNGNITVTGAVIDPSSVPGLPTLPDNGFYCGENSDPVDLRDANGVLYTEGGEPVDLIADTCVGVAAADPAPTVTIGISDNSLDAGQTATVTFTFSEVVTGFSRSDVEFTGTLSTPNNTSGNIWQATYTAPSPSEAASYSMQVTGSYVDSANQLGSNSNVLNISVAAAPDSGGGGSVGSCEVPEGVIVANNIDPVESWGSVTNVSSYRLHKDKIVSGKITTGSNPNWYATIKLFGDVNTANNSRRIWLSECPGGPAVAACAYNTGNSITWRVRQSEHPSRPDLFCNIGTNKEYYLNLQHPSGQCNSSTCWALYQYTPGGGAQ